MTNFGTLDNPIWHALTTVHASLAHSNGLACRYASDVSPLAGLSQPTPSAFSDLAGLVAPGQQVGLFTAEPIRVPADWQVVRSRPIEQMICTGLTGNSPPAPQELQRGDVPEMLALTAATEPGPFLTETIRMGRYFGVRSDDGRLIAMAGERLKLTGFTEISAVCTLPEFRGHGYAQALVTFLVALTLKEGKLPFLHVKGENPAKSLYEKLGFRVRLTAQLSVVSRA